MTAASLPAYFRSPIFTSHERENEGIELSNLGSAAPAEQAHRASRVGNGSVTITGLLARECKQLHANLVAGVRDIGNWFASLGRKTEQLRAPAGSRAAFKGKAGATTSQVAMKSHAATEPAKARTANARQLFSGKACSRRAQGGKVRPPHDLPASSNEFATLKQVLGNKRRNHSSAARFIRQINRLYYRNKLASQINELNLAELKFLWSHISQGGQHSLTTEARSMLCARGNELLCIGFQEDAIAHLPVVAQGMRPLPDWAATAPAEWNPKAALRSAYGMQTGQRGIRSSASRPSAAASSQNHPQTAAPAARRDKAASAPASGSRLSR